MQDIEVHSCDIISWQASFPVVRSGVFVTFRLAAVKLWNKERQKKEKVNLSLFYLKGSFLVHG